MYKSIHHHIIERTTQMLGLQNNAYSVRRMQHLLHLITITTRSANNTIIVRTLRKRLRLTEQLSDILDALRLLLVFTHHAQGRSEEFLAVLHLCFGKQSVQTSRSLKNSSRK